MNKGELNAVGRLGSTNHTEYWDKGVRSMPRQASENEQSASEREGEGEEISVRNSAAIAAFGSVFVGCFIVGLLIARMFSEDEIKLHILDFLVKLLQSIARQCGAWAIECENAYNEYVNILH